ncbi:MAG: tetratricopeptide repeat protein [Chitinispirillia bacterium]|nr:tetratricopeptide repeat protein [Chitinispirillia bacterium]
MMAKIIRAVLICGIAAIAMSTTGCSHITVLRTKELKGVQDTLSMNLLAVQAKLIEEQAKLLAEQHVLLDELRANNEMLRLLRADQVVRFNQSDNKISAIERNLYENQTRLSRLDQQTSEVNRRLERRMAAEEVAEQERRQQMEKLFEIAMSDFNAGRYDLAINGFQDFARQYPDTPHATDAEYWTAESHFAKKDYAVAEKAYMDFVRKHPDGSKSCAALYKLGLSYEQQQKMKSRDMVWNNLIERCSDSQEAQAVKTRMGQ